MKVKQPALLQQLRKDPKALRQLLDFLRQPNGTNKTVDEIKVANQTYTVRRSPLASRVVGY